MVKDGTCKYGSSCRFSHQRDVVAKAKQMQRTTTDAPPPEAGTGYLFSTSGKSGKQTGIPMKQNADGSWQARPTYLGDESGILRQSKAGLMDVDVAELDLDVLPLPVAVAPPRGWHYEVSSQVSGLEFEIQWIPDTGADGATLQLLAAKMMLVLQKEAVAAGSEPRALTDLGRLSRPQWFYGFMGSEGGKTKIDVVATLRLLFPSLRLSTSSEQLENRLCPTSL